MNTKKQHEKNLNRNSRGLSFIGLSFLIPLTGNTSVQKKSAKHYQVRDVTKPNKTDPDI